MANIMPVNQMIDRPDYFGAAQQGLQFGQQQRALREQRADQQQLRTLAPQVIAGDPGATAQAAAIDPQAAGAYQGAGDSQMRRVEGLIKYMRDTEATSGPQAAQAVWASQGVPFVRQFSQGTEPTTDWQQAKQMLGGLEAKIAMAKAGGPPQGSNVQSTRIGADGFYYTVDRAGNWTNSGVKADPRTQFRDQPGLDPGIVDLRAGTITPITSGGQAAPSNGTQMAPGEVPFAVDPSLPSNVQSAIRTAESQGQAWDGGGVGPLAQAAPSSNAAAARPAFTPAQQAEIEAKQSRTLTPEEVAQRGYRPGSIVQVDGYGTETVKQAPAQDRAAMSDAERKSILAAKAKVPQLQNAIRGLSRIDEALKGLEGGLVDTGPLDQYAQRYTKAGQELESAVGAIQNSFLALTRVPGIGAQSDLEARIAALQYPSLGKDPEVNRRTMEQLKFFAQDLASAYQSLLQNGAGTNPQPAPQDAAQGNAPSIIRYDAQGNRL